jgi:hypothetical protein
MTMKKIISLIFTMLISFAFAQDEPVPYFQGPYFERFYSPLELSELATLEVTLAIREAVQNIGVSSETLPSFTFVSRQGITTRVHDLLERMFSPIYGGDTSAFREWLETYYTQEALAEEMQIYYSEDFYAEALEGSHDTVDTKDFADALMMFLTASYVGANLLQDGTPAEHDLAVREQVRAALARSPRFAALTDDDKQRGVLLLLFFTSRIFGDLYTATTESRCAANDQTPGRSEATFYCGKVTEADLVGAFAESTAQVFGFRVRDFVMNENGFERKQ